jgi:hypothetical protein
MPVAVTYVLFHQVLQQPVQRRSMADTGCKLA